MKQSYKMQFMVIFVLSDFYSSQVGKGIAFLRYLKSE